MGPLEYIQRANVCTLLGSQDDKEKRNNLF